MVDDGDKKRGRTLRGDLQRLGHFLGLYPDDEHGKHVLQPKKPSTPAPTTSKCTEPGCDIAERHKHVPLRYTLHDPEEDEPMSHPGPNHPANRAHFDTGSKEHLPEGVVSLNAYREAKARKRPEGY